MKDTVPAMLYDEIEKLNEVIAKLYNVVGIVDSTPEMDRGVPVSKSELEDIVVVHGAKLSEMTESLDHVVKRLTSLRQMLSSG